jgi:hypothetical protein
VTTVDVVEVHPPQRRREEHPEHCHCDDCRVDGGVGGADADRHDRFAERDDHDQAMSFGEVAGYEAPTGRAEQERSQQVAQDGDEPQHLSVRRVDERGADEQADRDG